MRCRRWRAERSAPRCDDGSAVVDFVLVSLVLVPLVLGIVQLALVLHVRNTLTAAASEGARYGATVDRGPDEAQERTRLQARQAVAARFTRDVVAEERDVDGVPTMEVRVRAVVPPLGLWGPGVSLDVVGHAVEENAP